jgi:peptidoglycan/xylan/chitin deacetylase (PgdA/CDA1 family)
MTAPAEPRTALVSIDVETDWGGRLPPRREHLRGVHQGLPVIEAILARHDARATWYVNGQIVGLIGERLRAAVAAGHEIGSHAFTHRRLPELSAAELDHEIADSKAVLEDALGRAVAGFRAPQARIPGGLHRRLAEQGYGYDSSVFRGVMPTRFRNLDVPVQPYRQDGIWEVPVSKLPLLPHAMGLLWVDQYRPAALRAATAIAGWPRLVHLYLHPFDVIPAYAVDGMPQGARLWYRRPPGRALRTLDRLLTLLSRAGFRFETTSDLIDRLATASATASGPVAPS